MATLLEQQLGMRLLEIAGADFCRRDMRRNSEHGHARAVAIEEAIDQMQIAGAAASGADRKAAGEMRLSACRECRDFLVADVHPFDLALPTQRVGETVEAIADDSIDPLDIGGG
jgi:hypothetical protein